MLKLTDIRLTERPEDAGLRKVAADILSVPEAAIKDLQILKLSVDARRKPDVRFVYSLLVDADNEKALLADFPVNVSKYDPPEQYMFPSHDRAGFNIPPVITGAGPAGLFSALCLAESGVKCIVLERGAPIEQRIIDVDRFWRYGDLDVSSNVLFGEGGAGTFSDGKLTTGLNDKRIRYVLRRLVEFGAPEDILYLSKPHIGTDKLRYVIRSMREHLTELGCDVRFGHKLSDILISDGAIKGIAVETAERNYKMKTGALLIAPGNSARDTFEMLLKRGIKLIPKDFSVGVRIEHLQQDIDEAQYGRETGIPGRILPASDYKMVAHLDNGRSVYTFCVCPGGQVVAAASEPGGVVTNGMSQYKRGEINCNGALLVTVSPDDFGHDPFDGIRFQRKLESAAYIAGGGNYCAPAQYVGDFLNKRASVRSESNKITPSYLPGVKYCNLWDVLPEFVCKAISSALPEFAKRVSGFAGANAVLTAVESRSSSSVRIERDDYETTGIRGIFPCGEGSGYAGGIMSAAVDGIKAAEHMINGRRKGGS